VVIFEFHRLGERYGTAKLEQPPCHRWRKASLHKASMLFRQDRKNIKQATSSEAVIA